MCVIQPFPFYKSVYKSSKSSWIQSETQCSEKLMAFPELCPGCDTEHLCATWKLGSRFTCFSSDLSHLAYQRCLALALGFPCAQCRERCLQEWFRPFGGEILFWNCPSLCWLCKERGQLWVSPWNGMNSGASALNKIWVFFFSPLLFPAPEYQQLASSGRLCSSTLDIFIKWLTDL